MYDLKAFVFSYDKDRKVMKRHYVTLKTGLNWQDAKEAQKQLKKFRSRIVKQRSSSLVERTPDA